MPANVPDFSFLDGVEDELEGVVFVGVGVENVGDAVVDTPLEPTVDVLLNVLEGVVVIVSDVRVGLPRVVSDGVEMVVAPVLFFEQALDVLLDERGEAVARLVVFVWDMELFSELYRLFRV